MHRFLLGIDCLEMRIESKSKYACRLKNSPYFFSIMRLRNKNNWNIQWWKNHRNGLDEISFLKILDEADPAVIEELLYHIDFFGKETVAFSSDMA